MCVPCGHGNCGGDSGGVVHLLLVEGVSTLHDSICITLCWATHYCRRETDFERRVHLRIIQENEERGIMYIRTSVCQVLVILSRHS